MAEPTIRDFHAHIYFDPAEVELAKRLAAMRPSSAFRQCRSGIFTCGPVGPHPRGQRAADRCRRDQFGDVAQLLALNRGGRSPSSLTRTPAMTSPIIPGM